MRHCVELEACSSGLRPADKNCFRVLVSPSEVGNLCRLTKTYRRATNDRGNWTGCVDCACKSNFSKFAVKTGLKTRMPGDFGRPKVVQFRWKFALSKKGGLTLLPLNIAIK